VRLWNLDRRETERVGTGAPFQQAQVFRGHTHVATVVGFSPDGQRLVSGGQDGAVRVWDLAQDPEHGSMVSILTEGEPEALAFAEGGRRLLTAHRAGQVMERESGTHALLRYHTLTLSEPWRTPGEVSHFDAEGRLLAAIPNGETHTAECWDLRRDRAQAVLRGHTVEPSHVTLSADGRRAATAGVGHAAAGPVGEVIVWDAGDGRVLFQLTERGLVPTRLALDAAGERLALAGVAVGPPPAAGRPPTAAAFVRVFDITAEGGRERSHFRNLEDVHYIGLAFGPDGRRLAWAGGESQNVRVWDLDDGRELVHSREGPPAAMDVAFSPDCRRLAIAARPQIKLLDAATGEEVLILRGTAQVLPNTSGFNARVRFSPDGKRLLAICHDLAFTVSEWSVEDAPPVSARADEPDPAAASLRLRAAERRAVIRLLGNPWVPFPPDSLAFRHHYQFVRDIALVTPWEYAARAQMHESAGRPEAADADLTRAAELAPDDPWVVSRAAGFCARHGQWSRARAYYDRVVAGLPSVEWHWISGALVRLAGGDRDGYRAQCREILRRFAPLARRENAGKLALVCLLLPDAADDVALLGRIIGQIVLGDEAGPSYAHRALARALAEYRAGHFEAAGDYLTQGENHQSDLTREMGDVALLALCRALVEQRLHHADAAREALTRADRLLHEHWPQGSPPGDLGPWWEVWVEAQTLRREAAMLVEGSKPGPGK
jgi:WD40 repeat protein